MRRGAGSTFSDHYWRTTRASLCGHTQAFCEAAAAEAAQVQKKKTGFCVSILMKSKRSLVEKFRAILGDLGQI